MANLLWGNVYYKDLFAGVIREDPGARIIFTYDRHYIDSGHPALAYTLPIREDPFIHVNGLHPFFDNLVSEGWLKRVQSDLLGQRESSRFALLLAFGFDCAGAVSVIDPAPAALTQNLLDRDDPKEMAVLTSRALLSGVQPKLAIVKEGGIYRKAEAGELSTHIAKLSSPRHANILDNEYLTSIALKALLPDDDVAEMGIGFIKDFGEQSALLIKRFDRCDEGRVHFEEFNALLNKPSDRKYEGAYKDMAEFIHKSNSCLPTQTYLLYRRILAGILLGNTDMHLKNFAMYHTENGLRLTPNYDQVAAYLYNYKCSALEVAGSKEHPFGKLKARHLIILGEDFGLSSASINMAIKELAKHLEAAKDAICQSSLAGDNLKDNIITVMEKRWNAAFASIGTALSKKQ